MFALSVARGWWVGTPLGVLIWVGTWSLFGAGTGTPDLTTGLIVVVGWIAFVPAIELYGRRAEQTLGLILAAAIIGMLMIYRIMTPKGTSLITLAIDAGLLGAIVFVIVDKLQYKLTSAMNRLEKKLASLQSEANTNPAITAS